MELIFSSREASITRRLSGHSPVHPLFEPPCKIFTVFRQAADRSSPVMFSLFNSFVFLPSLEMVHPCICEFFFGVFVLVLFCSCCSSSPSVIANTDDFGGVAPNVVDGCEGVALTSDGHGSIVSDV